ncbi:SGNH/GDSL hydrolase family protein [Aspergillus saccharolyticus JOP 1030-1]|uniref:Putative extracellular GDSL-like lipase/acylhydrolase n=1 Tax=Aspergillus saccharolyticus JOP 1030-1 TaxID=1450539 RepID=A0A318Z9A2_9EURO|nr:putative extracellular GDSL-like lipase/acylhydrolase [Aspergillus saccharolyticus JOP 1030-1]PYH41293.1 putative extracellular GDSL-like lipase/acylhydrolase [Aspergillus saccharolyticus JOP 1030-1]
MPQLTEPGNLPPDPFNASSFVFFNTTLRQTLRLTHPASTIRLRLSNAFGLDDLDVTNVSLAHPVKNELGASSITPNTVHPILFDGFHGIIIPPGSLAVSDPIQLPSARLNTTLTVDIYLAGGQTGGAITSHPGSRTTSWMQFGNSIGTTNFTDVSVASVEHWYFISTVEAYLPSTVKACAILGDSITDGRGSDNNQNNRWPDLLLNRLQSTNSTLLSQIPLLNQAAGGNRILHDSLGPSLLSRIDRDVLAHSQVHSAILFEGVNDIGTADTTPLAQTITGVRMIRAYRQIVTRLHAAGIPVFGATITPFGTPANSSVVQPYSDAERERTRQRVNAFIRESGVFDAVLDFDAVLRDPDHPEQLRGEYDSGDHLHPNVEGYEALAESVDLGVFLKAHGL